MRVGQDQGPPVSVAFLLARAGERVGRQMDHALEECGLSRRLFGALGHLHREPDLSLSDLGRRSGVTAQSMLATVVELERGGFVVRTTRGRGRRAEIALTEHGQSALRSAKSAITALDRRIESGVPAELRGPLIDQLMRLAFTDPE
jgi:DNA-binding MarR family transcriptional regulator